jgi:prevent-host-death family protein
VNLGAPEKFEPLAYVELTLNTSDRRGIMTKEISAMELRQKFGELLDGVYYKGDRLIVKRANKPMAAIIPIETYEQFLKQREKAFAVLDRIWAKAPTVSKAEAEADVEAAITEARAEKARRANEQAS